jgi:hypothetical protein
VAIPGNAMFFRISFDKYGATVDLTIGSVIGSMTLAEI